ncbi:MAG: hypothetical protein GY799_00495 [Desulfobulbaceae bacterium]|nr:hypothetical protein [Desulfobulbaceae bacterium]
MDWVEYKTYVIPFRQPFDCCVSYLDYLTAGACECYLSYRECNLAGSEEDVLLHRYGMFLYYMAEIENMTVGIQKTQYRADNDFGMVRIAMTFVRQYREGMISSMVFASSIASWQKTAYMFVVGSPIVEPAIMANIRHWDNLRAINNNKG